MRVLIVEPLRTPYKREIGNNLKSMQKVVGGYIQAINLALMNLLSTSTRITPQIVDYGRCLNCMAEFMEFYLIVKNIEWILAFILC